MMERALRGVIPVLHTPFTPDDEIDRVCLEREIDWIFDRGVSGICAAMVSEVLRMTAEERVTMNHLMVEMAKGRGVVVSSVGAESTGQALRYARAAREAGCDAIMAIPPISASLSDNALAAYYCELADRIDLPLIVQDASSYVGRPMPLDICVELLGRYGPNKILFKPEASPIGPNLSALRDRSAGQARMFDGSGGMLLIDAYRRGIVGTMPGADLLDGVVALWNALESKDEESAYRIYYPICAIVALQLQAGLDGYLAIEKYILVKRGIFTRADRRRPYSWELDAETQDEIDRLLEQLFAALRYE